MAVKVVYDSTRGLVQENDATGAGGFEIKDAFLDQGVEGTVAAPIVAVNGGTAITTSGVTLVKTNANNDLVTVADADAANIGQMKTIIYLVGAGDAAHDLKVNANGQLLTTLEDQGDVALLMWNGTDWLLVGQS
tara:strand:+ start:279 stop:680 length:402 start_codon:yes stop_codon:yes gene_type:complete